MKKTLLATAVSTLMVANVSAVELYNDGKNSFSVGGHLTVELNDNSGDTKVTSNSPRINFSFDRDLGNGWALDSRIEWGLSAFVDSKDDVLSNRLGYIGVGHDTYGRISAGKQWSTYVDVTGVTDQPIAWGSDSLFTYANGTDGGDLGLGRANNAMQYRNGVSFGNAGDLNVGVQWQGVNGEFDDRIGASATYNVGAVKLGYAYSGGDVDYSNVGQGVLNATSQAVSVAYGTYGDGLNIAAAYAWSENLQTLNNEAGSAVTEEANGREVLAAYGLQNGINVYALYQGVEDDTNGLTIQEYTNFGVEYNLSPNTVVYGAYKVDHGNDIRDTDDAFAVGVRIYL
ncbi:porin [Ferrimonas marina]|uniref:Outer membrane protein (Porin) n=1 Tax=Ferrimonas marina TaxID=299255 RepID=A0A1M5RQ66_9GAMM|nr:porin [Ferrimonas marina]SHH27983.1 Outer membrane protein (porin) [Ferrimonas marina]